MKLDERTATNEVAKILGVSDAVLRVAISSGRLPRPEVFAGRYAWTPENIEAAARMLSLTSPLNVIS